MTRKLTENSDFLKSFKDVSDDFTFTIFPIKDLAQLKDEIEKSDFGVKYSIYISIPYSTTIN